MAEQRLIDATSLKVLFEHEYRHNKQFKQSSVWRAWQGAIQLLYDQPTIDPETLPIVRQLREELEKVTAERDALLKEIAGECGLCANYENCKKYPAYCINGNMWEWCGPKKEE